MKLWLDDIRLSSRSCYWAKTPKEAVSQLVKGTVTEISLDHDLEQCQEQAKLDDVSSCSEC